MKRTALFTALTLLMVLSAQSQIAQWLIEPAYETISIAPGQDIIITEAMGEKTLWNFRGEQLSSTSTRDIIHPFAEGYAVTTTPNNQVITGFYDQNGRHTDLKNYTTAYSSTRFIDGYLLVQQGEYYGYIGTDGQMHKGSLVAARPFSNGYASCNAYKNFEKKKDLYPMLLTPTMHEVEFSYNGSPFKYDEVDFISSINDENVGIVVIKDKVYTFDGQTKKLTPLYATKDGNPAKKDKQVKVDKSQSLPTQDVDGGSHISAADKKQFVTIKFDELNAPVYIQYANNEMRTFDKKKTTERTFHSELLPVQEKYNPSSKYGLFWGEKIEVLPEQFDEIGTCIEDKAFVKLNGKWGMLQVFPDEKFDITLNKGNRIAFKHKTHEVPLRLSVPARIETNKTKLEIIGDDKSGCRIFPQTARASQSYDGHAPGYIEYDCELDFPAFLPDEINEENLENNEISYDAQVVYNGLRSPVIPITAYGWHYKYVTPLVSDEIIQNGDFSCTLRLERDKDPGEQIYHLNVSIYSDTLFNELITTSANLYTVKVYQLHEGLNTFEVTISEGDELTPIDTSFDINVDYEKPARKTDKQPVKPKTVVSRKKTYKPAKPAPVKPVKPEKQFIFH